ncbi:MAG: hypothetical protein QOG91_312, partial [Candidatus Parcubacteria bacterium]|nr:hypothetical protein [Candidatus Parcubacteria bacterium]
MNESNILRILTDIGAIADGHFVD